jgi:hypothetical protein
VVRVDSGAVGAAAAAAGSAFAEPLLAGAVAAAWVAPALPTVLAGAWLAAETVELRAQAGLDKDRESGWTRRDDIERNPSARISASLMTLGQ